MAVATVQADELNVPINSTHQRACVEQLLRRSNARTCRCAHAFRSTRRDVDARDVNDFERARVCSSRASEVCYGGTQRSGPGRVALSAIVCCVNFESSVSSQMERTAPWQPAHEHEPLGACIPHDSGACCSCYAMCTGCDRAERRQPSAVHLKGWCQ